MFQPCPKKLYALGKLGQGVVCCGFQCLLQDRLLPGKYSRWIDSIRLDGIKQCEMPSV